MATINPNCFVKWSVSGGTVAGKVQKIHTKAFSFNGSEVEATDENQVAEVLLASGQVAVAELSALASIDEVSYKSFVADFAAKLMTEAGANYMNETEVKAMKDELAAAKAEASEAKASADAAKAAKDAAEAALAKANADAEAAKSEAAKAASELASAKAEIEKASAEIAKFNKEKIGMARYEVAAAASFVDIFGDKADSQKSALAELSEAEWALAMKMGGKLTAQTVTTEKKLTDQTVTSQTKLTDAGAALDGADKESDTLDAQAALAAKGKAAPDALREAMLRSKNAKKSEKSSK